jgi:hypothetical protein
VPGILVKYPYPKKVDIKTLIFFIEKLSKLPRKQLLFPFLLILIFQQFCLLDLLLNNQCLIINLKGKTVEKLGLIGKEKAIACEVIISLTKHD